jgi:hypothetical protein
LVTAEFLFASYNFSRILHTAAEYNNESDLSGSLISEDAEVIAYRNNISEHIMLLEILAEE